MEAITPEVLLILFLVGLLAGFVDAIAGGGGLLALPVLLSIGLTPVQALATTKAQAVFGSGTAAWFFIRRRTIAPGPLIPAIACTFVGAGLGALAVRQLTGELLATLIPLLLIGFAILFAINPTIGSEARRQRIGTTAFGILIGTSIGFYDGFFGPGTGTFFAAAFVLLLGDELRRATAGTKLLNFTSNFAALLVFSVAGDVLWTIGIAMGLAQMIGARLGAAMVLRHGARLVRPLLVLVSLSLSVKLLLE